MSTRLANFFNFFRNVKKHPVKIGAEEQGTNRAALFKASCASYIAKHALFVLRHFNYNVLIQLLQPHNEFIIKALRLEKGLPQLVPRNVVVGLLKINKNAIQIAPTKACALHNRLENNTIIIQFKILPEPPLGWGPELKLHSSFPNFFIQNYCI